MVPERPVPSVQGPAAVNATLTLEVQQRGCRRVTARRGIAEEGAGRTGPSPPVHCPHPAAPPGPSGRPAQSSSLACVSALGFVPSLSCPGQHGRRPGPPALSSALPGGSPVGPAASLHHVQSGGHGPRAVPSSEVSVRPCESRAYRLGGCSSQPPSAPRAFLSVALGPAVKGPPPATIPSASSAQNAPGSCFTEHSLETGL